MKNNCNNHVKALALIPPGNIAAMISNLRTTLFQFSLDTSFLKFPEVIILSWMDIDKNPGISNFIMDNFKSLTFDEPFVLGDSLYQKVNVLPSILTDTEGPFKAGLGFYLGGKTEDALLNFAISESANMKQIKVNFWQLAKMDIYFNPGKSQIYWEAVILKNLKSKKIL